MRTTIRSAEFDEFFEQASPKVKEKIDYLIHIIENIVVINTKFVKKLTDTDFYELRISTDNEYRVIIFCIDNENIIQAKQIYLLNGFLKKSTKDYTKQISIAKRIIDNTK